MSISSKTKRLLLARSGGYCQNPDCNSNLYPCFEDGTITSIEELAHIIAQQEDGPRGDNSELITDRDKYDNIILLCPNCHTKIDKNPNKYCVQLLQKWKVDHEEKIKLCFHVPVFENRSDLRAIIYTLLMENYAIFAHYGPQSYFAKYSTQSEASKMWKKKAIETIIPNNRNICELLDKNFSLLNENEIGILARFKLHKEGFEYNKLSGDKNPTVPLFPKEIIEILK